MSRALPLLAALPAALLLAACGKVTETATEKMAEKMIESQMAKDGTKAKVDLSSGSAKVTTTDASGKTATMEFGSAQVSEADLGVPFYPGTKPAAGGSSRMATPEGTALTVAMHSDDTADKVAAFYRDKLKAQSAGKQFMDMSGGDGDATLMLADDKAKTSLQVHVGKSGSGSDITIVAHRGNAK
jgi:hypothetical protein